MKIVVLGGGFAGLAAAFRLKKKLKKASILVIDKNSYHTFSPALSKLATGKISQEKCLINIEPILKKQKITFLNSEITKINVKKSYIITKKKKVTYDYLIKAIGSETNFFRVLGAKKNSYVLKTAIDAIAIRNNIEDVIKRVSLNNSHDADKNIVVVGGGLTGIELATDLIDYVAKLCRLFNLASKDFKVHVIEKSPKIFQSNKKASKIIGKMLSKMGIIVHTGKGIEKVTKSSVIFAKGKKISSNTIIWAGGIIPNKLVGEENTKMCSVGSLVSDEHLQSVTKKPIFEAGDTVICYDEKKHIQVIHNAPNAIFQGKLAADNIINLINNKELKKYKQKYQPSIITLGRKKAIFIYKKYAISGRFFNYLKRMIRFHYLYKIKHP